MEKLLKGVRTLQFLSRTWYESWRHKGDLERIERFISENESEATGDSSPVVFFNASTRTWGLSQNAAFSLLASWGLRLSGVPVAYFVCEAGMQQCPLGTVRTRPERKPPCTLCSRLSRQMYSGEHLTPLRPPDDGWDALPRFDELDTLKDLKGVQHEGLPLGALCFPSLQWVMRCHNVPDDAPIRELFRKYLRAGIHLARAFRRYLEQVRPRCVVVFNGVMFPEAIVRRLTLDQSIPVITHEVGVRPFSAFFTYGEATAYPIEMGDDFELGPRDEAILDRYLEDRFKGAFTMAGVRFWPEMQSLERDLLAKMEGYPQTVAVFSNVIFDTSQVHANLVFSDMFDWLEQVVDYARRRPETLFVVRAHPDELRPGKESLETVEAVLRACGAFEIENLVFIPPREYVSSYELIKRSKLVLVYNSSIGLEATLLGRVVLCGGKARYTDYPTVFFPSSPELYFERANHFLAQDDPTAPEAFIHEARRFTYYQHFFTSLDFSSFLKPHPHFPGYVFLRDFDPADLHMDRSEEIRILRDGILHGKPLFYPQAHVERWAD
jgi:hypothetical protein